VLVDVLGVTWVDMMRPNRDAFGGAAKRPLRFLLGALLTLSFLVAAFWHLRSHDESLDHAKTMEVFDLVFEWSREKGRKLRLWNGDEHFCIIAPGGISDLSSFAEAAILSISATYELAFSSLTVGTVNGCDADETDVYVLLSSNPGYEGFATLLESIVGSRPPRNVVEFEHTLGFMMSLPGIQKRSFVYVPEFTDENLDHSGNSESIFLEELLHVLSGGSDFISETMISQMGAHMPAGGYEFWFEFNPRGWCSVDFLFMELLYGGKLDPVGRFHPVRDFLNKNFSNLLQDSMRRRSELLEISDDRC